jgi:thiol-disulfide isomerase/thioredoxin
MFERYRGGALLLIVLLACGMRAAAGPALPRFALRDTAGVLHSAREWAQARAIVLFFVTTDCPLANSYTPEMNRIEQKYAPLGVHFYAVQADPSIPEEEVRKHAREFGYEFPALLDPAGVLVSYTGAAVTPEAAVLSPQGELLYLGRIDNLVEAFGKTRYRATETDLRDALDAILAGRPVPRPRTHAVGCFIPKAR